MAAKRAAKKTTAKKPSPRAKGMVKKVAPKPAKPITCQAPDCGKKFRPYGPLALRQRFCSPACRQRAFYWEFKKKNKGKRYASVMGYGR